MHDQQRSATHIDARRRNASADDHRLDPVVERRSIVGPVQELPSKQSIGTRIVVRECRWHPMIADEAGDYTEEGRARSTRCPVQTAVLLCVGMHERPVGSDDIDAEDVLATHPHCREVPALPPCSR